jgi:glycosyltransferase involved in cell wall biosynthesis
MFKGKKVVVVMPAYNAEKTIAITTSEIDQELVDEIVVVDDHSTDNTKNTALELGIKHVIRHDNNKGYGGNQKTCYHKALDLNADIVVMLHPDYQYTPLLIPAMVSIIGNGLYPVVFGSRILGKGALKGGMPLYKYMANRILTFIQNLLMNQKLGEYHTGYRAYSGEVLSSVNFEKCSDDFVFDNEIIAQIFNKGFEIGEITCPTKYFEEASSINLSRSVTYGLGVLRVSFLYFLNRIGFIRWGLLKEK